MAYDAWLGSMFHDVGTGRPKPNNNSHRLANPATSNPVSYLGAPINYEMPLMDSDGVIRAKNFATHHSDNAQLSCESASTKLDWRYLRPYNRYRILFTAKLDNTTYSTASWNSHPWAIMVDLHPGSFGGSWAASQNPPIGLYIESGSWVFKVRGSTQATPTGFTNDTSTIISAIDFDWNDWEIVVEIDYTGNYSYTELKLNDVSQVTVTHSNGINAGGNTVTGGEWIKWGSYSSTTGPEILYDKFRIYDLG